MKRIRTNETPHSNLGDCSGNGRSGWPLLDPGLVLVMCASPGLCRVFFTITRTREKLWLIPLHVIVCEIVVCTEMPEEIIPSMVFGFVHSLLFIDND